MTLPASRLSNVFSICICHQKSPSKDPQSPAHSSQQTCFLVKLLLPACPELLAFGLSWLLHPKSVDRMMEKKSLKPHTTMIFPFNYPSHYEPSCALLPTALLFWGHVGKGTLQRTLKPGPENNPTPSCPMLSSPQKLPKPGKHTGRTQSLWMLEKVFERILGD